MLGCISNILMMRIDKLKKYIILYPFVDITCLSIRSEKHQVNLIIHLLMIDFYWSYIYLRQYIIHWVKILIKETIYSLNATIFKTIETVFCSVETDEHLNETNLVSWETLDPFKTFVLLNEINFKTVEKMVPLTSLLWVELEWCWQWAITVMLKQTCFKHVSNGDIYTERDLWNILKHFHTKKMQRLIIFQVFYCINNYATYRKD